MNGSAPQSALDGPSADRPAVLVAGSASRDVTDADPRGWRMGGAVMYGSLVLARLGLDVRALVGADRAAAVSAEIDLLRAAGVDVETLPLASGPIFENIEHPGGRRQRCLAISSTIPAGALPSRWVGEFDAIFLAPVAGELGDDWAAVAAELASRSGRLGEAALGWQGLLRHLRAGADVRRRAPAASPLLRAATLVAASRNDFEPGTSPERLIALLAPGATLLLTDGASGGVVIDRQSNGGGVITRTYVANPSVLTVDPTGAGDVFLAAMLACRLRPSLAPDPDAIGRFAAAAAALSIEAPGLLGISDVDGVRRRMASSRIPPSDASRPTTLRAAAAPLSPDD